MEGVMRSPAPDVHRLCELNGRERAEYPMAPGGVWRSQPSAPHASQEGAPHREWSRLAFAKHVKAGAMELAQPSIELRRRTGVLSLAGEVPGQRRVFANVGP